MLKHLSLSEYRSHDCGLDRAAAQMEDLQSADSLGRRLRALIRAPCSTIHHPLIFIFSLLGRLCLYVLMIMVVAVVVM